MAIDDSLDTLERFVVLLYEYANDARKQVFTQKGRAIDALPPTREALRQHIWRTAYKAGYCCGQMMVAAAELPSPSEWGWMKSDTGWGVCWTTLPEATIACRQLLRCGCKKGCRGQCQCRKAVLHCTALCLCSIMDGLENTIMDGLENTTITHSHSEDCKPHDLIPEENIF